MSHAARHRWKDAHGTVEVEVSVSDGALVATSSTQDEPIATKGIVQRLSSGALRFTDAKEGARPVEASVIRDGDVAFVCIDGETYRLTLEAPGARAGAGAGDDAFAVSPMTGTLATMDVEPGEAVAAGMPLFVVEAMKMEYVVKAPRDVTVAEVRGAVGGQVEQGAVLVTFESEAS